MRRPRTLGLSLAAVVALSGMTPVASGAEADGTSATAPQAAKETASAEIVARQAASEDAEEATQEASEAAEDASEAAYPPKRFPGYAYKIHFLRHMIGKLHLRKLELRELPRASQHRLTQLAAKKELIEKYRSRLHEVRAQLAAKRASQH
jgi:hypothetical protein